MVAKKLKLLVPFIADSCVHVILTLIHGEILEGYRSDFGHKKVPHLGGVVFVPKFNPVVMFEHTGRPSVNVVQNLGISEFVFDSQHHQIRMEFELVLSSRFELKFDVTIHG